MKKISILFVNLILVLFFSSCQNEIKTPLAPETESKEVKVEVDNLAVVTTKSALFAKYFTTEEQAILLKIKAIYEKGISDGFTFDDIGEAYSYNAGVLKSDLFNKIPHTLTFPYNGKFSLSTFEKEINKLSFITKKCGFQDTQTEKLINYYCPNLDEDFFAFLEEGSAGSKLIKDFHNDYMAQKVINNEIKRNMVLMSDEELDFDNFNHQLFYMLFHIYVNEEQKAMEKLK